MKVLKESFVLSLVAMSAILLFVPQTSLGDPPRFVVGNPGSNVAMRSSGEILAVVTRRGSIGDVIAAVATPLGPASDVAPPGGCPPSAPCSNHCGPCVPMQGDWWCMSNGCGSACEGPNDFPFGPPATSIGIGVAGEKVGSCAY